MCGAAINLTLRGRSCCNYQTKEGNLRNDRLTIFLCQIIPCEDNVWLDSFLLQKPNGYLYHNDLDTRDINPPGHASLNFVKN